MIATTPLLFEPYTLEGDRLFAPSFEHRKLVAELRCEIAPATWHRAGWLKLWSMTDSFGLAVIKTLLLGLNEPQFIILREDEPQAEYQISFEPVDWLNGYAATLVLSGVLEE